MVKGSIKSLVGIEGREGSSSRKKTRGKRTFDLAGFYKRRGVVIGGVSPALV